MSSLWIFILKKFIFLTKIYQGYEKISKSTNLKQYKISTEFPYKKSNMVSVDQNTAFCLIVKVWSKINSRDHMPTSSEFFLKSFFNVLSCIFKICDFSFEHFGIDVLCYQHGIIFHVDFHVTELNISRYLYIRSNPILWNASSCYFFIVTCSFCLFLLGGHLLN